MIRRLIKHKKAAKMHAGHLRAIVTYSHAESSSTFKSRKGAGMGTRYFQIDNTPEVGRVNTFICHASGTKGYIHFFNADIRPAPLAIKDIKKHGTEFFIVKLYIKSSEVSTGPSYWQTNSHTYYIADETTLAIVPITVEKRLPANTIVSVVKETGFTADGGWHSAEKLRKVIHSCLNTGIDLSDCCREMTKIEYDDYMADLEHKRKAQIEAFYRASREKRMIEVGKRKIIRKAFYSRTDSLFHVVYGYQGTLADETITFTDFDSFYRECKGKTSDADLLDYHFEGIDLEKYDLSWAKVSSEIMAKLGTYSDEVHQIITKGLPLSKITPSKSLDLVPARMEYSVAETYPDYEHEDEIFLYISDMHLNHKLLDKFPDRANRYELERFFADIAKSLKQTMPDSWHKQVFIIGDVSFDFDIFKKFFEAYHEQIFAKTYFVLGNHELWDEGLCKRSKSFEEMVSEFRAFLDPLGIELLESELKIPHVRNDTGTKRKYSANEVLALPDELIREIFRYNSYAILGGMGFAGLNTSFNCENGIYRNAPITREFEIAQSKLLSEVHEKLKRVIPDKKLIVVTHMPFSDWCDGEMVPNWIYISGHTHKNYFIESDEATVYADNQIGYTNSSFGFKFFALKPFFNIFADYPDGIHEISRDDYNIFNFGLCARSAFYRDYANLYMLKRERTYMFLMRKEEDGPLFILNGGSIKKTFGRNFDYFYDKMVNYAKSVRMFLGKYSSFQKQVSKEIRTFGGNGTIHGCIVDIDFYNHIYLNPLDGAVIPYNAESMTSKHVYSNIASLLYYCAPKLYDKYIGLIGNKKNESAIVALNSDTSLEKRSIFVEETDMYRVSRILKGLQFTTQFNVIRLWNYAIADEVSEEAGRLIVSGIIDPDSFPKVEDLSKKKHPVSDINKSAAAKPRPKRVSEKESAPSTIKPKISYFEKHKARVSAKTEDTVELVSLPDCKTDASLRCTKCGYTWSQRIDHFYRTPKCPKCRGK